jgi:hypothetical protein
MNIDVWVFLITGSIFFVLSIMSLIQFKKFRDKDYLITLITNLILFLGSILVCFFPLTKWFHMNQTNRVIIGLLLFVILLGSVFYSNIKKRFKKK